MFKCIYLLVWFEFFYVFVLCLYLYFKLLLIILDALFMYLF